jgi:hypothetical protein
VLYFAGKKVGEFHPLAALSPAFDFNPARHIGLFAVTFPFVQSEEAE